MLIFALVGMAFGASGAFWWAHFNTQVSQLRLRHAGLRDPLAVRLGRHREAEERRHRRDQQGARAAEGLPDREPDHRAIGHVRAVGVPGRHARRPGSTVGRHRVLGDHRRQREPHADVLRRGQGGHGQPRAADHAQQGRRAGRRQRRQLGPGQRPRAAAHEEGERPRARLGRRRRPGRVARLPDLPGERHRRSRRHAHRRHADRPVRRPGSSTPPRSGSTSRAARSSTATARCSASPRWPTSRSATTTARSTSRRRSARPAPRSSTAPAATASSAPRRLTPTPTRTCVALSRLPRGSYASSVVARTASPGDVGGDHDEDAEHHHEGADQPEPALADLGVDRVDGGQRAGGPR